MMLISIQYMRAIAAILVVIHHAAWKGEQYSTNPLEGFVVGNIGVDLFFIISGYIMCFTSYKREVSFLAFIRARIIRIIPLYWVLTSVALLIYLLLPDKVNSSGGSTNILASYLLYPVEGKYLVQNGWSLSYEFYFYFIFALGLSILLFKRYVSTVVILMVLVLLGFFLDSGNIYINFLTNQLLAEFIMGIVAFFVVRKCIIPKNISLLIIFLSVTWVFYLNIGEGVGVRLIDYGIPCCFFFIAFLSLEKYLVKASKRYWVSIFQHLGDSSYSLYLFHPFVLTIMSIMMSQVNLDQYAYVFVTLLIVASIIGGHCCYLFLEQPLNGVLKNKVLKK